MTTTPTMSAREGKKWISFRQGEPCGVFDNRAEAVKWFQGLLKQILRDFEGQGNKACGYDYPIEVKHLFIRQVDLREESMGL